MTTDHIHYIVAISFKSLVSISNIIGIFFTKTSMTSFTLSYSVYKATDIRPAKMFENTLNSRLLSIYFDKSSATYDNKNNIKTSILGHLLLLRATLLNIIYKLNPYDISVQAISKLLCYHQFQYFLQENIKHIDIIKNNKKEFEQ